MSERNLDTDRSGRAEQVPDSMPRSTASTDPSEVPFLIVGNPRSGTTLMRFILSSHSRIYIPEETGFLPHLTSYLGRRFDRSEVEQLVRYVGQLNAEWLDLVSDYEAFYSSLPEPTLTHVLDQLYRIRILPHGAQRWGDKGPSYVRVLETIDAIFPTAKYIHMIRDGRDCSLSALKKWGERYRYYDVYYLMATWLQNVRAGRAAARWLGPDRYLEVRYEEMVADVEPVIRRVCDFLGEAFEPQMLDHTPLARQFVAPTGHFEVERPVSQGSVGTWRNKMSQFDQKLATRVAGRELAELGYDVPDLPRMTFSESLAYGFRAVRFRCLDLLRRTLYRLGWLKMSREKRARRRR